MKKVLSLLVIGVAICSGYGGSAISQAPPAATTFHLDVSELKSSLQGEGFDSHFLDEIFAGDRLAVDMNVLRLNIFPSETPADYSQFLTPESIQSGRNFLQEHRELLETIQRQYGVEKEIITAILLVESRFGTSTGKYSVFNVYSTLAMAGVPENALFLYQEFRERYPEVSLAYVQNRARRRSEWAYRELVTLLRIVQRDGLNMLNLKGSWAGAFGLAQFLPSSFLKYAVDGDNDQKVDLYHLPDAVASIGNYLKNMGWRPGLSPQTQHRLIRTYNNSTLYADTILALASRITR